MFYPSIRGDSLTDYAKYNTCNLLHAYIYAHIQRLIYEYLRGGVQKITRLQSQCARIDLSYKSRYNIMFQKVVHKLGELEINHIKIFQNAKALEISVVNSYFGDQLMHTFL